MQPTGWVPDPYRYSYRAIIPSGRSNASSFSRILIKLAIQLMGHEIVIILAGFTWGLGVGFAIAAAGTFLGEIVNF
jgi:uncharacterized membrane protein YdjX (TVP38/TMEM64 family)